MSEQSNKKYYGLWSKNDKNGQPFLSGGDETRNFFVFLDKKDPDARVLFTSKKGVDPTERHPLERVAVFTKRSNDRGEYLQADNMFIFPNDRRSKETHPHFNLIVHSKEA